MLFSKFTKSVSMCDSGYWVTDSELLGKHSKPTSKDSKNGYIHWQNESSEHGAPVRCQPFKELSKALDAIDVVFTDAIHRPVIILGHILRGNSPRTTERVLNCAVIHMSA